MTTDKLQQQRDVLRKMRQILKTLSSVGRWTQSAPARNRKGKVRAPEEKDAVRFSLGGAWHKTGGGVMESLALKEDKEQEVQASVSMLVLKELCKTILHRLRQSFDEFETRTPYMQSNILSMFNDWHGRTYAQVRAVILETINRIERDGLMAAAA